MAKIIEEVIDTNDTAETSDDKLLFLLVTDNADTTEQDDDKSYILRKEIDKVFLQSKNVNIFPCSRRGRHENAAGTVSQYDPEARLNTERTNRLHTAVNGLTDSFIESFDRDKVRIKVKDENTDTYTEIETKRTTGTLIFSLAGYHVEAKNFDPDTIATALGLVPSADNDKIYAYLRLHTGVSVDAENYFTEMLYRQSTVTTNNKNYLDVSYADSYIDDKNKEHKINDEFFVGVSFVNTKIETDENDYNLPLFSYAGKDESGNNKWDLIQTSLLPKIEHGESVDSIVIAGNATFNTDLTIKNDLIVENLLTSKEIKIPSDKDSDGTTINNTGIQTLYTYTKSLAADGISVGNEISIGDDSVKTTVGAGTLATSELKTDNIISDSADGLIIEPATTLKSTLTVEGQTALNNGLVVSKGDTSLQKLTADSLEVTNNTTLKGEVQIDKKTTINNSLAITGVNNVSTPTLKVNTVTSDAEEVIVDKPLKVNSTLDVNSGKTTLHKGLAVKEGLTVESGITSLKSALEVTDKAKLNNGLEVTKGDAIIKSNLNVEDNINVGTPTTPATADNGGYVVAKKDITAEQDLIAKRDINVGRNASITGDITAKGNATIKTGLVVGERVTDDSTEAGTITAKKLVKTPTLEATTEIKTPQLRVDRITSDTGSITVDNKKLVVNKSLEMLAKEGATDPATATIEKVVIGDLTVKTDTKLKNSTGKITTKDIQATNIDTSTLKVTNYINVGSPASPTDFTGNISAKNEITAEARLRVPNTFRAESSDQTTYVQKLSVTDNITAKEVAADKITQNGNAVPAINLVQSGTAYQLQITLDASKK